MKAGFTSARSLSRAVPHRLFETDPDGVGFLAVNGQNDVNLAAPGQGLGQPQIDLIQADEISLRARVERLNALAADARKHAGQRAAIAQSRAEEQQEDLIGGITQGRSQLNRHGDKTVLRRVEARHRLVALRAAGFDAQHDGCGQALPGSRGGKKRRRDVFNLRRPGGDAARAVADRDDGTARRRARRNQIVDLLR